MKTILLVPTGEGVGLTSASLGLVYALECQGVKAGFVKPFSQEKNQPIDGTTALYRHLSNSETVEPIAYETLIQRLSLGESDELLEEAVRLHRQIAKQHDVIIVEGLVPTSRDAFASEFNATLAKALDAQVIVVSNADVNNPVATADKVDTQLRHLGGAASDRTAGVLFMRTKGLPEDSAQIPVTLDPSLRLISDTNKFVAAIQKTHAHIGSEHLPVIGLVPFSNTLSVPRISDLAAHISAEWINKGEASQRRVLHSSLIASNIEHELNKFVAGELIISASDRIDVLLASSLASCNGIPLAGLVLTEHHEPNVAVLAFCQAAIKNGLPILHTSLSTFETAQSLSNLSNEIPVDDTERAEQVTRFVSSHINLDWLVQILNGSYKPRLSPSAFRHELVQKSMAAKKRIVLPEGDEPRTIQAAAICQSRGIAHCVLLAKPEVVIEVAKARNIELPHDLEIIDPDLIRENYVPKMVELRKGKINELQAREQLQDTVVLGTMMLALDQVDGLVSGAVHTTANTVRPAFQLIKTAPDYSLVSSVFFMLLPDEVYVYGDCAINPDPDAEQLAEIAIQSADSAKAFGIDPRIAMISYSTGTSGTGADVEKVAEATRIAKERRPDLLIDGPLQYDAASVESVGQSKAPGSPVAGRANVFIFPDLNTGNTTYKAVQRAANVVSVGPMLQGLNKPVNDLSRGALVDDIVFTIALTAIQAEQQAAQ
ncbi:phosphate acetyltransferase [Acinetobacter terrae]|jgi:phosphate acetyltransferase|uniref:Phosphate acetyltransferase n=1 Tax=Acinetobacter terrae TaxID=2731247 RepID=A0A8E4GLX4_9GAMM|nr:phosphate acetyltransferase [Acinetobacter terrae]NNH14453.1 phosphate acetyltransferase [Acinetobacter terrae]NNH37745.1 phosphate acetyltransferase [Acinetobacter terrae]OAL88247.1 phosphate acetyltransferase [Acinetobacter terrae]